MATLSLMIGAPGSGKTTFLKKRVKKNSSVIISRDKIRFALLQPGDEYFSHENDVKRNLWKRINEALENDYDVFVDQTSLTPVSRKHLLDNVKGYDKLNAIWINEDLETCLENNEKRKGTKFYVPKETVKKMYGQLIPPSFKEGFNTIYCYNSKENKLSYIRESENIDK